ncbi:MAG: deoxyuridine 5'-triphosphate nucleotidohydrolase [Firmicutes bacterium]|nr:deoxyuridine 5'-triphosphate nucleotidohydrolase [Bacillota bacterium]
MRGFEKISFTQFCKDINNDFATYENYQLPKRHTKNSAGYDIVALDDYTLIPGGVLKIPTGIKAFMNNDEVLLIVIRSSFGFKYNARLCNQVGVIDSDYYNNIDNEGHIFISLQNEGNKDLVIKKGEHFAQGIFTKFLTADNEKEVTTIRQGGIGSTNEGGK